MNRHAPLLLLALWVLPAARPAWQAPGFAEITSPAAGEAVRGIATLAGTANHPAFDHFDLAFGYDPDPTDTWFPIVDLDRSKVVEGRLAVWDTTGVADGVYRLRLRVWPTDGDPLVAIVQGVRVDNLGSHPAPTPGPTAIAAEATQALATATPAATPTVVRTEAELPSGRVRSALIAGALIGGMALALVGLYAAWRSAARAAWGTARTHRTERRRRTKTQP